MRRTGFPTLSDLFPLERLRTRALAFVTSMMLAVGVVVAATVAPQAAYAAPGDPFDPADPYVFIGQDLPTRLYTALTDANGTVSFTPEGPVASIGYNAIAYNTLDNYIYGISRAPVVTGFPSGSLIRIGQGGVITRVGSNTFTASLAGVFGPSNYLYILTPSSTGTAGQGLTRINVSTGAQVGTVINLSNPINSAAYGGGARLRVQRRVLLVDGLRLSRSDQSRERRDDPLAAVHGDGLGSAVGESGGGRRVDVRQWQPGLQLERDR